MPELALFLAAGALLAAFGGFFVIAARWCELQSTTGAWQFSVILLRLIGGLLLAAAIILLLGFNALAIFLVAAVCVLDFFSRRRMWQESLVWILALTTARNLPLAPSVHAFAQECSGGYRWRVVRFAKRLSAGLSLGQALSKDRGFVGGLLTRDGAAAVCVGAACGDLPGALLDAARVNSARRPLWNDIGARAVYLGLVLTITALITTGYMFFIMPAMMKISDDFDVTLPTHTVFVRNVANDFARYGVVIALFVLLFAALLLVLGLVFRWDLPGLRFLSRNRHAPPLLRALAGVIERRQPLLDALRALADGYSAVHVRRRLKAVYQDIERGDNEWNAFARRKVFTRTDVDVLHAAARVGNLPWAMRALADGRERRQGYRIQLAAQLLWPMAIVAIGALVGAIVVAGFQPIVTIIESFTNSLN